MSKAGTAHMRLDTKEVMETALEVKEGKDSLSENSNLVQLQISLKK
jgi:hypothetical protein